MTPKTHFSLLQRSLHWSMAAMVLSMLFIGVGMVSTVQPKYLSLLKIHESLGLLIFVLAGARLIVRARSGAPPLPAELPSYARAAAMGTHYMLYGLMLSMPLVGWATASSAGSPLRVGSLRIPALLSIDEPLHALFLKAHIWLGLGFFALILLHVSAALFHALVRHDGVFSSMAKGSSSRQDSETVEV